MMSVAEVSEALRQQLGRLQDESRVLIPTLREMWPENPGHFAATLWGMVMNAFAFVDLVSWYWTAKKNPQTERMVAFLVKYVGTGPEAAFMAVEMWRHTLMHTGEPRPLRRSDTGVTYSWLLHWSTEMPRAEHLTLSPVSGQRSQPMLSLEYLLEDLRAALEGYLADVATDPALEANLLAVHPKVLEQELGPPPACANLGEALAPPAFTEARVGEIAYALPSSAVFSKFYNRDVLFEVVDWSDWQSVVNGFQLRFEGWYFDPLDTFPKPGGHEAYVVLCTMSALVDAFTHYAHNKDHHEPRHYKEFLRKLNPVFRKRLSREIPLTRWVNGVWQLQRSLRDFADVFYAGVRCSLHHHGDLSPFAGMSGTGELAKEYPNAVKSSCGTQSFPIVVFDPWVFREELRRWFDGYCTELRQNPRSDRAKRFRARFKSDFAISQVASAGVGNEGSD